MKILKDLPAPRVFGSLFVTVVGLFAGLWLGKSLRPSSAVVEGAGGAIHSSKILNPSNMTGQLESAEASRRSPMQERYDSASGTSSVYIDTIDRKTGAERLEATRAFIAQLSPEDFLPAIQGFEERYLGQGPWGGFRVISPERQEEYRLFLEAWAEVNPMEAMSHLHRDRSRRVLFAYEVVMSSWAKSDPEAAYEWAMAGYQDEINSRTTPCRTSGYVGQIVRELAATDLPRATEMLYGMRWQMGLRETVENIAGQLVEEDPERAKAWAETFQIDRIYRARGSVALAIAKQDPAEAARWLAEEGDLNDLTASRVPFGRNPIASLLASSWYDESPDQAKEWVASLPPDVVDKAAPGVIRRLVEQDPLQAAEWLAELMIANPQKNFFESTQSLVAATENLDGEVAAVWVSALPEDKQAKQCDVQLTRWLENDPQAALDWVQANQSILPEATRRKFLSGAAR